MSEENVEVVRRIYETWNTGDPGLDLFDPSFELHQTATVFDSARVFRGHEGLLRSAQELLSGLRDLSWEPHDFIAAPDDRVVVPFRFLVTGRSTGLPFETPLVHVWTVRDELVIRCDTYDDLADALEAAGLSG
jgi:ketosteroid isomerase-like protein